MKKNQRSLLAENKKDLDAAEQKGLSKAMIDRLTLNPERIMAMADGLREVAALPDPVGEVLGMRRRPNGMEVGKMRVPIGLIGIIYESRPNVTADTAALCLKSGNGVILRGGSEAVHSNTAIVRGALQGRSRGGHSRGRGIVHREPRPRLRHGDAETERHY